MMVALTCGGGDGGAGVAQVVAEGTQAPETQTLSECL